jgi:HipA-like protein
MVAIRWCRGEQSRVDVEDFHWCFLWYEQASFSVFAYLANAASDDFVSLTMPVRTESYVWDDVLHPVFQMNLPEDYLLQVLQEQFGPHLTGSPIALLAVVGRNMVGRMQVAAAGANLAEPAKAIELEPLLRGDNSEDAFAGLVRQHATSGVSAAQSGHVCGPAGRDQSAMTHPDS